MTTGIYFWWVEVNDALTNNGVDTNTVNVDDSSTATQTSTATVVERNYLHFFL